MYKIVSTPDGDWSVLYYDDVKIHESSMIDGNCIEAIAEFFKDSCEFYEFTNEDEHDGETPDKFSDIRGLKQF